jgi:hypothetical protein
VPQFAVSKAQTDLWTFQAQLKVFDFKWITDRTATQVSHCPPSHLFSMDFTLIISDTHT